MNRRKFLGGTATVLAASAAGCVGDSITGSSTEYPDEQALIPPDDLLGDGWQREPEQEGGAELTRAYVTTGDEQYKMARISIARVDPDEDLEQSFDDMADEFLVDASEMDIGDEALYDEVDGFAAMAVRHHNAVATVLAAQMRGLSYGESRTACIDAANALVDYWTDEVETA